VTIFFHIFPKTFVDKNMSLILIIDDEENLLRLIQQGLVRFGYQVEIAGNGKEGIRKFDRGVFDVVITDLVMPEIDGRLVLQHIRSSQKQHTPVICISGTPWLADLKSFDSVINKPFTLKALAEAVKAFI
jgi:CheY-like chemotaxis protein